MCLCHCLCICNSFQKPNRLVGFAGSTYVQWAAYLGDTPIVRLYIVDSLTRRKRIQQHKFIIAESYNWTNPKLKSRIRYETYTSDDVDEKDSGQSQE